MIEELRTIKLLSGLPDQELKSIAKEVTEVRHSQGSHFIVRGRGGVGFMMVVEGEVSVAIPDGRTRLLQAGDSFGEMALLDQGGRSSDVVAATDVRLFGVPEWAFKPFLTNHPEVAWRLLQQLSQRVREAESR